MRVLAMVYIYIPLHHTDLIVYVSESKDSIIYRADSMNSLMVYVLNITTGLIFSSQPWRGFGKLYIALSLHIACPPDADIMSCPSP